MTTHRCQLLLLPQVQFVCSVSEGCGDRRHAEAFLNGFGTARTAGSQTSGHHQLASFSSIYLAREVPYFISSTLCQEPSVDPRLQTTPCAASLLTALHSAFLLCLRFLQECSTRRILRMAAMQAPQLAARQGATALPSTRSRGMAALTRTWQHSARHCRRLPLPPLSAQQRQENVVGDDATAADSK